MASTEIDFIVLDADGKTVLDRHYGHKATLLKSGQFKVRHMCLDYHTQGPDVAGDLAIVIGAHTGPKIGSRGGKYESSIRRNRYS